MKKSKTKRQEYLAACKKALKNYEAGNCSLSEYKMTMAFLRGQYNINPFNN